MLDGCVNNAIGLIDVVEMSGEQHTTSNPNEEASDPGDQDETRVHGAKNPFVPEVAKVELEDVYVDIDDVATKAHIKIPAIGWFVLVGVLFCIGAIFLMSVFKSPSLEEETVEVRQLILANEKENEKEELKIEEHESTRLLLQQLNACIRSYYAANEIGQKLKYVRHPERVRGLMENHYQERPMIIEEFGQLERYSALNIEKVPFVYGRVQMQDGKSHDVLLEKMADGSFRLDWESEVHYQPISWDDFISQRPSESVVMRVSVKPDSFYVYQFRDSSKYDCYQLSEKNSNRSVFGYVVKGSETSIQLRQFFMRVKHISQVSSEPMMLQLRFPEGDSLGNCVHIDRLVAPRWFLVGAPEILLGSGQSKTEE